MFFKKKKESESETELKLTMKLETIDTLDNKIKDKEQEEWVWVEGYKMTDTEMKGYKDYQFNLNDTFICDLPDDKIIVGVGGFHFSLSFEDNLKVHTPFQSRFFKVNGLVRKKDLENCHIKYTPWGWEHDVRLATKQIKFLYELPFLEIYPIIKEKYPLIRNRKDLNNYSSYDDFLIENYLDILLNSCKSYSYSKNLLKNLIIDITPESITRLKDLIESFEKEPNLSADFRYYLIHNYSKNNYI